MEFLLLENKFITQRIDQKTQQHIPAPGCRIPEGLQIHQSPERRIEEIDDGQDEVADCMEVFTHWREQIYELVDSRESAVNSPY